MNFRSQILSQIYYSNPPKYKLFLYLLQIILFSNFRSCLPPYIQFGSLLIRSNIIEYVARLIIENFKKDYCISNKDSSELSL